MLKEFLKTLRINEQKISMILGVVVVMTVGILIYNYFSSVNRQPTDAQSVTQEQTSVKTHKVVQGESLWKISLKYYNDGYKWVEIAKLNNLDSPDLIEAGQILNLLEIEELKSPETVNEIGDLEYLVVQGDSLWTIAVRAYADGYQWAKIWEANKTQIANANVIEPGTKLSLPR